MENALTIRDWSPEERPREKLTEKGTEALDAAELLAIIIGSGTRKKSALDLARDLIHRFGGVSGLARASVHDLMEVRGIGLARAVSIVAAFELCRRRERCDRKPHSAANASEVAHYFRHRLADLPHEEFWVLYLDRELGILGESKLGKGDHRRTVVDIWKLFAEAYQFRAHSVLVLHNHPSGSLRPSAADFTLTENLRITSNIFGLPLRDHLIISRDGYFSFAESGNLHPKPSAPSSSDTLPQLQQLGRNSTAFNPGSTYPRFADE